MTTVAAITNLTIGYTRRGKTAHVVAKDISVSLNAGELVCLIGPNGVGKSTLLRTLAGMQNPLEGQVQLMGRDVRHLKSKELAQHLSIVLTERVQVGIMSVYALVALGRYPYTDWSGQLTSHDESVVRWAIEAVGATELAHRNVGELSDGERQKVMIARALAQEPKLILLDEPTAFLDLPHRVEMMQLLRTLARQTGQAVLLSTHDLDLALRSADRIWLLSSHGEFQIGAPEDLILSGAFESVFRSEGVFFDKQSGSFTISQSSLGKVRLTGEGIHAQWTKHAVERAGFIISESEADALVTVATTNEIIRWYTEIGDAKTEHHTIYDLISMLKSKQTQGEGNSST